jgi:hypothetical protein
MTIAIKYSAGHNEIANGGYIVEQRDGIGGRRQ